MRARKIPVYEIGIEINGLQYLGDLPREDWKWDARTSMFKCVCGKIFSTSLSKVRNGNANSCGCVTKAKTHNMSKTRQYRTWQSMKRRCDSEKCEFFHVYGGRGITYCDEWSIFENFWKDMSEGYDNNLELDRIDPDKNYCKDNCRWVSESVQSYNKRISEKNTTGKVGVYFNKNSNKWQAMITKNNIQHYLGSFDTFEAACEARELAEIKYHGFNINKEK